MSKACVCFTIRPERPLCLFLLCFILRRCNIYCAWQNSPIWFEGDWKHVTSVTPGCIMTTHTAKHCIWKCLKIPPPWLKLCGVWGQFSYLPCREEEKPVTGWMITFWNGEIFPQRRINRCPLPPHHRPRLNQNSLVKPDFQKNISSPSHPIRPHLQPGTILHILPDLI